MPSIARSELTRLVAAMSVAVSIAGSAGAQAPSRLEGDAISVRNARLGADDVAGAARFYEAAFGMQEVKRYERPGFLEIILAFGRTRDEAMAAKGTRIALISRKPGQTPDGVSNLVLDVGNMERVMARIEAGGGTVERPPTRSAVSGRLIAMVRDPAGNRVELIAND